MAEFNKGDAFEFTCKVEVIDTGTSRSDEEMVYVKLTNYPSLNDGEHWMQKKILENLQSKVNHQALMHITIAGDLNMKNLTKIRDAFNLEPLNNLITDS